MYYHGYFFFYLYWGKLLGLIFGEQGRNAERQGVRFLTFFFQTSIFGTFFHHAFTQSYSYQNNIGIVYFLANFIVYYLGFQQTANNPRLQLKRKRDLSNAKPSTNSCRPPFYCPLVAIFNTPELPITFHSFASLQNKKHSENEPNLARIVIYRRLVIDSTPCFSDIGY